jgi:HNH endonuclease
MKIDDQVKKRFTSKIERGDNKDDCWIWIGTVGASGYGHININGSQIGAHRVSYVLHKSPIPPDMLVCHTCDIRRCVNPEHLFLGSVLENNRDAANKGKFTGEKNGRATLTLEKASQILTLRKSGLTAKQVGEIFGATVDQVYKIWRRKTWKHISS